MMSDDIKSTGTYYKYCIVPCCESTTHKCASKLFFSVPKDPKKRSRWLSAMKRDDKLNKKLSSKSSLWCCEDHFSIEEDMENYIQWTLTKDCKRLKLKADTVPHRFECQKRNVQSPIERKGAKKRKHRSLIEEALSLPVASTSADPECNETTILDVETTILDETIPDENTIIKVDFECQVNMKKPVRSKGTSTDLQVVSTACSPIKMNENSFYFHAQEYVPLVSQVFHDDGSEYCDSDYEYRTEDSISSEDEEIVSEFASEKFKEHIIISTVTCIEKDPKLYLGLPPKCFFVMKLLTQLAPLHKNHIYMVLKKLRLNSQFAVLADEFGLHFSTISRIFSKSLPVLASLMQELIVWPSRQKIRAHLPVPFRARYAKVESIIDCLEIPIEKPSNAVHQALTWSNYYNCNTVKYLVSCTPDGLVTYISDGYGGRTSDPMIIEDSGFLNKLSPGALVMADRGFKNVAASLEQRGCSLVRPPSVSTSRKCTKAEVKLSKRIAALRIHVERVIGRLRDFSMLDKHACIDNKLVPFLDYAIIIACGIINMQDHLIKKQI